VYSDEFGCRAAFADWEEDGCVCYLFDGFDVSLCISAFHPASRLSILDSGTDRVYVERASAR